MLILGNATSADKKDPPRFFAVMVDNRVFQSLRGSKLKKIKNPLKSWRKETWEEEKNYFKFN